MNSVYEIVQWCSFCASQPADGEIQVGPYPMKVCDECMSDYDNAVLPEIAALLEDE